MPRTSHAGWRAPSGRSDPLSILEAQGRSRDPDLLPIRHGRMLTSPYAFYRGGAAIMAADLASTGDSGITVQLCGDAHLGNFGAFASADRSLVFDINDFDETHPGPWEWDVKRLAASFVVAGRERGFRRAEHRVVVGSAVRAYREAMRSFAAMSTMAVWHARLDVAGFLSRWKAESTKGDRRAFERNVAKAHTRDRMRALDRLTHVVDGRRQIVADPPLVVPIEDLLADVDVAALMQSLEASLDRYADGLQSSHQHLLRGYRLVHFARKVVGVGSVGTQAWLALMLGRDDDDPLFLQLKEAQPSVLAAHLAGAPYDNEGERIVVGQRLMQASSDILLGWTTSPGIRDASRDLYVRQLWDWKFSGDQEDRSLSSLRIYAKACAWTLARAHARSGDRIAIAAYLGAGQAFDRAVTEFAEAYADQNEADHAAVRAAAATGRLEVSDGI